MANHRTLPAKTDTVFFVDPFNIYIPGIDGTPEEDADNPRMSIESNATEPCEILVRSMTIEKKNIESISLIKVPCSLEDAFAFINKTGGRESYRLEIFLGRHRVRTARSIEGFKFLKSEIVSGLSDDIQARQIIAENHARRTVDPIAQSEEIVRYESMGISIKEIAEMLGETTASIRNKKRLVSLAPDIQDQVRSGEIGRAAGYEVAKLDDHDDQRLAVLEGADGTHPEAIEAVDNVRQANAAMESTSGDRVDILTRDAAPAPKIAKPKKRDMIELRDAFAGVEPRLAAVLSWALGEIDENERDASLYDDRTVEPKYKTIVRDNKQATIDNNARIKSEKAAKKKAERAAKAAKKKAPERTEISEDLEDKFTTPPVSAHSEGLGGVVTL